MRQLHGGGGGFRDDGRILQPRDVRGVEHGVTLLLRPPGGHGDRARLGLLPAARRGGVLEQHRHEFLGVERRRGGVLHQKTGGGRDARGASPKGSPIHATHTHTHARARVY